MEFFGIEVPQSLILTIIVLTLLYLFSTWTYSTFKTLGIPGPTPWPIVGNTLQLSAGVYKMDVEWAKKYGKVIGTYEGRTPVLLLADPEICKQICVKNFTSFYNRRRLAIMNKPLDSGLTMLINENWKNKRNTLTPAFSGSKMRLMSPIVNMAADDLVKILRKHSEDGTPIQCKALFGCYVVDAIASTGFGVEVNSQEQPDHPFIKNIKEAFSFGVLRRASLLLFFIPFLVPVLKWFNIGLFRTKNLKYFTDLTEESAEIRKSQDPSTKRVDFLQLMLDAHDVYEQYIKESHTEEDEYGVKLVKDGKSDTNDFHKGFTTEEMLGQSLIFFLAGYETTSTLMSYVAYSMATNPDIQEKLCTEIDDVMANNEEPSYNVVSKMPYLDMIVCETLRMYPPSLRFDRECNEDVTIAGINIKKGMYVAVSIYAIHHNPEFYPEPEKFIPERFTKEEKEKRHPYAWLPFGAGPRNCIGMRFALLEAKIALVRIFRDFTLEPCAETVIPIQLGKTGFLSPQGGVILRVKARR
ncbi:cytochrome P450 3A5-like [Ptychodera flava]|uniref:cytochrome P450 3A5-like n=1 Tax=Ptychodera flava TaxID=63121 RepID=UPI00396A64A3